MKRSRDAYLDTESAKLSLACHIVLFGSISDLVAKCSADLDHLQLEVFSKLKILRVLLQLNSTKQGAERTVNQQIQLHLSEITEDRKNELKTIFIPAVMNAANKGKSSYDKHISPVMSMYELRQRFHISQVSGGTGQIDDMEYTQQFIGCSDEEYGNEIIAEWCAYHKDWTTRSVADPLWYQKIRNYEYWKNKETRWPNLSLTAIWWDNWPTSSIAAERTFALARIIDMSQRGSQSWETFTNEIQLKANQSILENLLNEQVITISKLKA